MATKSIVERNKKRIELAKKYYDLRSNLKNKLRDKSLSFEERYQLVTKLASIPRNSSKVRVNNLCQITGRSKGVYRKFGLCRNKLREYASYGLITGLIKASW